MANDILMGVYRWHTPWTILGVTVSSVFVYSYTSKRYKSTWMGIALHSVESLIFGILVLGLVLGLA